MHGGAADRSGLIHVGDEVCEVNGISVEGKTPNCVLKILVGRSFYFIPATCTTLPIDLYAADSSSRFIALTIYIARKIHICITTCSLSAKFRGYDYF